MLFSSEGSNSKDITKSRLEKIEIIFSKKNMLPKVQKKLKSRAEKNQNFQMHSMARQD